MKPEPKPEERLRRMRETFSQDLSILAEDYEYFTGVSPQDVPKPQNTDSRKSEESSEPPDQGRN
jgi:hypothetical protein